MDERTDERTPGRDRDHSWIFSLFSPWNWNPCSASSIFMSNILVVVVFLQNCSLGNVTCYSSWENKSLKTRSSMRYMIMNTDRVSLHPVLVFFYRERNRRTKFQLTLHLFPASSFLSKMDEDVIVNDDMSLDVERMSRILSRFFLMEIIKKSIMSCTCLLFQSCLSLHLHLFVRGMWFITSCKACINNHSIVISIFFVKTYRDDWYRKWEEDAFSSTTTTGWSAGAKLIMFSDSQSVSINEVV